MVKNIALSYLQNTVVFLSWERTPFENSLVRIRIKDITKLFIVVNWYHVFMIVILKWADTFLFHSPINNDEQQDVAKINCFKEYFEMGRLPSIRALRYYWKVHITLPLYLRIYCKMAAALFFLTGNIIWF